MKKFDRLIIFFCGFICALILGPKVKDYYISILEYRGKVPTKADAIVYFQKNFKDVSEKHVNISGPYDFNRPNSRHKVFVYSLKYLEPVEGMEILRFDQIIIVCTCDDSSLIIYPDFNKKTGTLINCQHFGPFKINF